jgi:hypothetical protein
MQASPGFEIRACKGRASSLGGGYIVHDSH